MVELKKIWSKLKSEYSLIDIKNNLAPSTSKVRIVVLQLYFNTLINKLKMRKIIKKKKRKIPLDILGLNLRSDGLIHRMGFNTLGLWGSNLNLELLHLRLSIDRGTMVIFHYANAQISKSIYI